MIAESDPSVNIQEIQSIRIFGAQLTQAIPFAWPKHNLLLQLVFILCLLLLAAGRILNLYIPIYNKQIGEREQ